MVLFCFCIPYTDIYRWSLCIALLLFPDLVHIRVDGLCALSYCAPWFHAYIHDFCALLTPFSVSHMYMIVPPLFFFFFVGYDHCLFHDFRAILNQVCPFVNLTLHIYPHRVLCPCAYAHLVNMTFHGLWICFVLIISMLPCVLLSWYPCLTVHDYYPCLLSILVILCFPLHCWADIHAFCPCPLPMLAVSTYRLHSFMCILKLISICLLPIYFHIHILLSWYTYLLSICLVCYCPHVLMPTAHDFMLELNLWANVCCVYKDFSTGSLFWAVN